MSQHTLEIVLDNRDEAEALYAYLEDTLAVIDSGGFLSLRSYDPAAAERAEIAAWLLLESGSFADKRDANLLKAYSRFIDRGDHKRPAPGDAKCSGA